MPQPLQMPTSTTPPSGPPCTRFEQLHCGGRVALDGATALPHAEHCSMLASIWPTEIPASPQHGISKVKLQGPENGLHDVALASWG